MRLTQERVTIGARATRTTRSSRRLRAPKRIITGILLWLPLFRGTMDRRSVRATRQFLSRALPAEFLVPPQSQPVLRKGRPQDVSAQTLHPRSIVRRDPTRWRAGRTRPGGPAAAPARLRPPCRAPRRAAAPAPPLASPAPPAPAPRPRRSPPLWGTHPRGDPPSPARRRWAPARGAPAAAARGGGSW